jgi:hypothetical protein
MQTLFATPELSLPRPERVATGREMVSAVLNAYYFLKPAIPQPVRFALRSSYALPLKWALAESWPVRQASSTVPRGWTGWPAGKSFAFALTHDVEGSRGLERCRQLAELEMRHGFRSSFNFVPEGEYTVPRGLLAWLHDRGFEVGVHDLHHDGSLYTSEKTFKAQARRINRYLEAWNAVGFRAGFMRHNLEWLQELNISYDASTFEHDPFEPQPDGANTIFPFLVRRPDGSSFVELPYTLAQDSTMFLVLRQTTTDLWKRKVDWIAQHGGMAMVIVHPDYMQFGKSRSSPGYPAGLYEEFLVYVRERYGDTAWFALPEEVADHVRHSSSKPSLLACAAARGDCLERSV